MKELWSNLKFTWNYTKNKKFDLIKYVIVNIITSIICILVPIISAQLIIKLTNNQLEQLAFFAVVIFLVNTMWDLLNMFSVFLENRVYLNCFVTLQTDLGKQFLKLKNNIIDKKGTGLFIERFTDDTDKLSDVFNQLNWYISTAIMYLGILIAVFVVNKIVFTYLFLTTILLNLIENKRSTVKIKYDKKYRVKREETSSTISEMVRGEKDIKMLNSEDNFLKYFHNKIIELNKTQYTAKTINSKYVFGRNLVQQITSLIFIILLIILIKYNGLLVVSALVLYNYSKQMPYSTQFIGEFLDELNSFNLSATRIKSIINSEEFEKEKFGKKILQKINGDFEFKNVEFSYGDHKVLDKINFKINANETVAFVGKSGAGKTTIFNLLSKLYDVDKGEITIDGININDLDKDSIRGNISIISQNPYIFNLSIRDNLKLVKENLTEEEMIEACKIACLDEYINSLKDGYNTIIGEGGVNLSGGQKQRLAIARALIQKTEIILFDEATSALDNETQANIQTAINNMKGEYTILIIAHRFSTIINCDRIYFIEDGKVIDSGNHSDLLEKCSSYKKLYESEIKEN